MININDDILKNKNIIKIIDGIAGCGKSQGLDELLKAKRMAYARFTSTNKLKYESLRRYGGAVDTIAGGLFTSKALRFYQEEKQIDFENIVIDEILQSDVKAIKYALEHRGEKNIFITCDSRQQLAPDSRIIFEEFKKLKDAEFCFSINLNKTLRARDSETEAYYYECYKAVDSHEELFDIYKEKHGSISYNEIKYNQNDIFICHTLDMEQMLYKDFDLYKLYNDKLIKKGSIARKNIPDIKKYPILPQKEASKTVNYLQQPNVATPSRYQGSEVTEGHKLYYLFSNDSKIEPREWYTVISRLWHIANLQLVECPSIERASINTYNGVTVKRVEPYICDDMKVGGKSLKSLAKGSELLISKEQFKEVKSQIAKDKYSTHYRRDYIVCNGCVVKEKKESQTKGDAKFGNRPTAHSLIKKEPYFSYDMASFYKALEKAQKIYKVCENVISPVFQNHSDRTDYMYALDLMSSYPHILNFAKLPTNKSFKQRADNFPSGHIKALQNDSIDWYLNINSTTVTEGAVITGEVASVIAEEEPEAIFEYIGSSSVQTGSRMGEYLHEMAHRNLESKAVIKNVHYGFFEKDYLQAYRDTHSKLKGYILHEEQNHKLLMLAIKNKQLEIIFTLKNIIYKSIKEGFVNADCLYFDYAGDIQELGERVKETISPYDFRISKNYADNQILYQSYEPILSRADVKRQRDRERGKRQREERRGSL